MPKYFTVVAVLFAGFTVVADLSVTLYYLCYSFIAIWF